jgi:hypothetical protein
MHRFVDFCLILIDIEPGLLLFVLLIPLPLPLRHDPILLNHILLKRILTLRLIILLFTIIVLLQEATGIGPHFKPPIPLHNLRHLFLLNRLILLKDLTVELNDFASLEGQPVLFDGCGGVVA